MTDRTKLIIAVTSGLIGLAIAVFATIVAINARDTAEGESEVQQLVTREVERRLDAEQRQRAREQDRRISAAEKFINSLDKGERRVLRNFVRQRRSIEKLNSEYARQRRSIGKLKSDLTTISSDQSDEFSLLSRRISNTQEDVSALENQVRRIRNELDSGGGNRP